MMRLASLLFCLLAATATAADLPKANILAPDKIAEHNLVVVSTDAAGTGYLWWVLGPRGFEKLHGQGQEIAFTGPPGMYNIMLAVILQGGGAVQAQATVTIGDNPVPPPPPPPPVPPTPDTDVAKAVKALISQVTGDRATVQAEAKALAAKYRATADRIAKHDLVVREQMPKVLGEIHTATNPRAPAWNAFFAAFAKLLDAHEAKDELQTIAAIGVFLKQAADGLEAF